MLVPEIANRIFLPLKMRRASESAINRYLEKSLGETRRLGSRWKGDVAHDCISSKWQIKWFDLETFPVETKSASTACVACLSKSDLSVKSNVVPS